MVDPLLNLHDPGNRRIPVNLGALGLTEASVGQNVAAAFRGAPLGQLTIDGTSQNVVLRLGLAPSSLDAVKSLPVPTATGIVPLGQIADVSQVDGPVQVSRIDGHRSVTVSGTATGSNIGATTAELTAKLKSLALPAGASYTLAASALTSPTPSGTWAWPCSPLSRSSSW